MKEKLRSAAVLFLIMVVVLMVSKQLPADTGTCGGAMITVPFTDVVGNPFFCQIAGAYFSGLTNGTTPTTYSPSDFVRREQMAAFVTRTQDSALRRGSRRAALKQWWTPLGGYAAAVAGIGPDTPRLVESDGEDLWIAVLGNGTVRRVHASDGHAKVYTGASGAFGVLTSYLGLIFVAGNTNPGRLYYIFPYADNVTTAQIGRSDLGAFPEGIATDGGFIWTANAGSGIGDGSVSKLTLSSTTNITTGFVSPSGILFDGSNIWVTDTGGGLLNGELKKLDSNGNILESIAVGARPRFPVFDGSNIWVPNMNSNSVSVVRARDGLVLATLTGNDLNQPVQAAFDGQRIIVTNAGSYSLSVWKAADLTQIGTFSTYPYVAVGACSDGTNFWVTMGGAMGTWLARY